MTKNSAENILRPKVFSQFIGQEKVKRKLELYCEAATKRGEPIDHVLLSGPPGLGKTTLANVIADALGVNIFATSGPAIDKKGDLAGLLTNLKEGDILFIDEIHRLHISVEETLYSAMEDGKMDVVMGEGPHARSIRIGLKPFSLIGATTRSGLLSEPLRDRFGIIERLEYYDADSLKLIVINAANKLGYEIGEDSAAEIGKRSRGTPRIALRLTQRIRDYLTIADKKKADMDLVQSALEDQGVDRAGLDTFCLNYLKALVSRYNGGPASLKTLAATLGEEENTIETVYESYLIQTGFIERKPQGRVASHLAFRHLGVEPREQVQSRLFIDEGNE